MLVSNSHLAGCCRVSAKANRAMGGMMSGQFESAQSGAAPPVLLDTLDFDAIYRGDSPLSGLFGDMTPWDISGPQPFLVDLVKSGQVVGDVLDAGCGLGDNSFLLARHGHRVTAFDASASCIEKARERARREGVDVTFVVADATDLAGLGRRFDTIVDSALYHSLQEPYRQAYIDGLHGIARPGARLHLVCFADLRPQRLKVLNYISEAELRARLAPSWRITDLRLTGFVTAFTREHMERSAKVYQYNDIDEYIRSGFDVDEQGRYLIQCWQVLAERV